MRFAPGFRCEAVSQYSRRCRSLRGRALTSAYFGDVGTYDFFVYDGATLLNWITYTNLSGFPTVHRCGRLCQRQRAPLRARRRSHAALLRHHPTPRRLKPSLAPVAHVAGHTIDRLKPEVTALRPASTAGSAGRPS
jgi:hypothetical protein